MSRKRQRRRSIAKDSPAAAPAFPAGSLEWPITAVVSACRHIVRRATEQPRWQETWCEVCRRPVELAAMHVDPDHHSLDRLDVLPQVMERV